MLCFREEVELPLETEAGRVIVVDELDASYHLVVVILNQLLRANITDFVEIWIADTA